MKLRGRIVSLTTVVILATFVLTSVPATFRAVGDLIPGARDLALVTYAQSGWQVDREIICQIKSGRQIWDVERRHNMRAMHYLGDSFFLMRMPAAVAVEQMLNALRADPDVARAEANYVAQLPEVSQISGAFVDQISGGFVDGVSPSKYFDQYAMRLIRAKEAQAFAQGERVTVAVIDTGVDTTHPVFRNVVRGYDFVDYDFYPAEQGNGFAYGHGTMVAGIIALVAREVRIMPVRAFNSDGYATTWQVANAIYYAAINGADVINMSFHLTGQSYLVEWAVALASQMGAVLVASAGNDNTSDPQYPASDDLRVLAVAATDKADIKASFSNYGYYVDVCAPGVSIYSAYPGGAFAWWDGTSFAAAFVSGEAALVLSEWHFNAGWIIRRTAVNIDRLNPSYRRMLGSGRIDALAAVRW